MVASTSQATATTAATRPTSLSLTAASATSRGASDGTSTFSMNWGLASRLHERGVNPGSSSGGAGKQRQRGKTSRKRGVYEALICNHSLVMSPCVTSRRIV